MFFNTISCTERANKKWEVLHASRSMTIPFDYRFTTGDIFFTIGSCFAEEVRKSLTAQDVVCLPNYSQISFDSNHCIVDTLPHREHMNYYNTFSILQEISRAVGEWEQDPNDYWVLNGRRISSGRVVKGEDSTDRVFQDPYRRLVMADSPELLREVSSRVSSVFRDGLSKCSVLVITLGMTEVFRKKDNQRVCNQVPVYGGGGGLRETFFYKSTFDDNIRNMRAILDKVKIFNPNIQVVLSVSPVPLHRSFGNNDIFVNNYASKCTLRAVAEQICDEYPWVKYFPSFEIVWNMGSAAYLESDLLHVKPEVVRLVIKSFIRSFFAPPSESALEGLS